MNDTSTTIRNLPSADDVLAGVLDLGLAAPLALGAFVHVSSVEWSTGVTTACVECAHRPRLLLNPDWVSEWCGTRERLAMLVLHELSHISLGHTRLCPRVTPAQNIAFDALINARLLQLIRQHGFDARPFAALPQSFYRADEAPFFILRPPPGWPAEPDWNASAGCPEPLRRVHTRIYNWHKLLHDVTYTEILLALGEAGVPNTGAPDSELLQRLLGGHGGTPEETAALSSGRDGSASEALERSLAAIENLQGGESGQGWGGRAGTAQLQLEQHRAERRLEQALRKLLQQVFVRQQAGLRRFTLSSTPILSVDPSHDRRAAARRLLAQRFGSPQPLLFAAHISERRPDPVAAAVYLDVSGSMASCIGRLHAALVSLRRLLAPEVFAFSCGIEPAPVADFVAGRIKTSYGTDITPVLQHAARNARARRSSARANSNRALVLTDGYFASPAAAAVKALADAGVALHVAVIGDGPLPVGRWVASAARLPNPLTANH